MNVPVVVEVTLVNTKGRAIMSASAAAIKNANAPSDAISTGRLHLG